ncbi:MAG: hypothetical protein AB7I25_10945 [Vicinamibacterales bacterium]
MASEVPLPPYGGLCMTCAHAAAVPSSRGSVFLQCRLALEDPAFRRYPAQPVLRCAGYTPASPPPAGD